jgi:putative ABC transport system substrate-binding protein
VKRREFIAGIGGTLVNVWPELVFAQKTGEMPRIAVVRADPNDQQDTAVFERGMRAAGWIKDINIRLDYYVARDDPQLTRSVVTEVVSSNPTIIVTLASTNTLATQRLTSTIPIVFAVVSDPIGQGIVTNFAHPGGNVTGFSYFDNGIGGKWLQLLREMTPQRTRFVSMYSPTGGPIAELFQRSIEDGARSLSVEVTRAFVHNDSEIEAVFERIAGAMDIALLIPSNQFTYIRSRMIAELAAKHRIPTMYPARRFAEEGGLVAYGPDIYDEIYSAASYVDRILKGAKPGDLPIQQPTKYTLVVNLRAAKALDLNIPPSLLARADEVIE